jgi:hypothetical protein
MIGSSLLSMPYAINEAGWALGIFIMLFMCGICLYCCLLILEHDQGNGNSALWVRSGGESRGARHRGVRPGLGPLCCGGCVANGWNTAS